MSTILYEGIVCYNGRINDIEVVIYDFIPFYYWLIVANKYIF